MLFDSHAHYNDERFDEDRFDLLSQMQENNVGLIMNSCSSLDEVPLIFDILCTLRSVFTRTRLKIYGKAIWKR